MDITKLWPTFMTVATVAVAQFAAPIEAFVSAHPTLAMIVGSVAVFIANLVHSPTAPKA